MDREKQYTSLNLWAARAEDQGAWLFGVTMDGADVVLVAKKLGGYATLSSELAEDAVISVVDDLVLVVETQRPVARESISVNR